MKGSSEDPPGSGRSVHPLEGAAFAAWITRTPSNVHAYLRERAVEVELEGLDADHLLALNEVIARARVEIGAERQTD